VNVGKCSGRLKTELIDEINCCVGGYARGSGEISAGTGKERQPAP